MSKSENQRFEQGTYVYGCPPVDFQPLKPDDLLCPLPPITIPGPPPTPSLPTPLWWRQIDPALDRMIREIHRKLFPEQYEDQK